MLGDLFKREERLVLKPEILTHPNIPKPLHGVAPREIMGKIWWDNERNRAYESTGYRCIACGVHKSEAIGPKWLEAHEYWDINYQTGICIIKGIYPLCHYCHNFIHSSRLKSICGKQKTREEVVAILEHGFGILSKNKLKCFYGTYHLARNLEAETFNVEPYESEVNPRLKWGDFKLIWEGKEYGSTFKNFEEWQRYYQNR